MWNRNRPAQPHLQSISDRNLNSQLFWLLTVCTVKVPCAHNVFACLQSQRGKSGINYQLNISIPMISATVALWPGLAADFELFLFPWATVLRWCGLGCCDALQDAAIILWDVVADKTALISLPEEILHFIVLVVNFDILKEIKLLRCR